MSYNCRGSFNKRNMPPRRGSSSNGSCSSNPRRLRRPWVAAVVECFSTRSTIGGGALDYDLGERVVNEVDGQRFEHVHQFAPQRVHFGLVQLLRANDRGIEAGNLRRRRVFWC